MWYTAKIVTQCKMLRENPPRPIIDESIILVEAVDDQEAEKKAQELARGLETDYLNSKGEKVVWEFVAVLDIYKIDDRELCSGVEVHSVTYRHVGADRCKDGSNSGGGIFSRTGVRSSRRIGPSGDAMWYTAQILSQRRVLCENPPRPLMEVSIILVEAVDDQEAEKRALEHARDRGTDYLNAEGEKVVWEFVALLDIYDIDDQELCSGVEVFCVTYGHVGVDRDNQRSN